MSGDEEPPSSLFARWVRLMKRTPRRVQLRDALGPPLERLRALDAEHGARSRPPRAFPSSAAAVVGERDRAGGAPAELAHPLELEEAARPRAAPRGGRPAAERAERADPSTAG